MDLKSIMLRQVTESERQILHLHSQMQILDFSFGMDGWMDVNVSHETKKGARKGQEEVLRGKGEY